MGQERLRDRERRHQGCGLRRFVSPVESCAHLVFASRAALDRLRERLRDRHRSSGHPDTIARLFGRRGTTHADAGRKTPIRDHDPGRPLLPSESPSGSIKPHARANPVPRPATTRDHAPDLGVNPGVKHAPRPRQTRAAAHDRDLAVPRDILETFVDRGQRERSRPPPVAPSGRRTPGRKRDDPRLLAVLQAWSRVSPRAGRGRLRTTNPRATAAAAPARTTARSPRGQPRSDLAPRRGAGLVERVAGTRCHRVPAVGCRLAVWDRKWFPRSAAPRTAGILDPGPWEDRLPAERRATRDQVDAAVESAVDRLFAFVGVRLPRGSEPQVTVKKGVRET